MNDEKTKTYIIGILNVTPDSFFDGGKYNRVDLAIKHVEQLISNGADIIDIGGESSRPGSVPIDVSTEILRTIPVIKEIKKKFPKISLSIDSYKYEVVQQALDNGVEYVNDIYSLRYSPNIINLLQKYPASKIILMHMQGKPTNMQDNPVYKDVIKEIKNFFSERVSLLKNNNIDEKRIILDPGIGFGKTTQHNLTILKNIELFKEINQKTFPLMIGISRKSFIGKILGSEKNPVDVADRHEGTIILHTYLLLKKINFVRSHDVKHLVQILKILRWLTN